MGNWRTVHITGTMSKQDAIAVYEYLGYRDYRYRQPRDPAIEHFGPLSFNRDSPSVYGLNAWPAPEMDRIGNLAERNYDIKDVVDALRELLPIAGSMLLKVHCGGDHETRTCVATIYVGEGLVAIGKPEVEEIGDISEEQVLTNLYRALTGGY